jgi:hypothetical protein
MSEERVEYSFRIEIVPEEENKIYGRTRLDVVRVRKRLLEMVQETDPLARFDGGQLVSTLPYHDVQPLFRKAINETLGLDDDGNPLPES